jgi:hypothetical protein
MSGTTGPWFTFSRLPWAGRRRFACPLRHGGRWFETGHRQHSGRNALPQVGVRLRPLGAARACRRWL